jgi:uncharacterized protein (DUF3084 family)
MFFGRRVVTEGLRNENGKLRMDLGVMKEERDSAREERDAALRERRDAREERNASQRSVDSLSAELKEVRRREETLLRRVRKMQELQAKLADSLELIYVDLKMREEG